MTDHEDVVETPLDRIATGRPSEDKRGRAARRYARDEKAHQTLPEQLEAVEIQDAKRTLERVVR